MSSVKRSRRNSRPKPEVEEPPPETCLIPIEPLDIEDSWAEATQACDRLWSFAAERFPEFSAANREEAASAWDQAQSWFKQVCRGYGPHIECDNRDSGTPYSPGLLDFLLPRPIGVIAQAAQHPTVADLVAALPESLEYPYGAGMDRGMVTYQFDLRPLLGSAAALALDGNALSLTAWNHALPAVRRVLIGHRLRALKLCAWFAEQRAACELVLFPTLRFTGNDTERQLELEVRIAGHSRCYRLGDKTANNLRALLNHKPVPMSAKSKHDLLVAVPVLRPYISSACNGQYQIDRRIQEAKES